MSLSSLHNPWSNIGIMGNQMETTIVHWGFIGIMEKKMEATIVFCFKSIEGSDCFKHLFLDALEVV